MGMNNPIKFIAAVVLLVFSAAPASYSIPVPHGVDGTILELDGITKIPAGTDFYVRNINNNDIVYGRTDSNGAYSVSLNGDDGNTVAVRAWNKYNQVNATFSLVGVMRNVNLYLNMTYPAIAPEITSVPQQSAEEDSGYYYQVEAYDENNDQLEYSLLEGPAGMSIGSQTGIVQWTPSNDDVGIHEVSIQVSDSVFYVNQSFSLTVQNINDAPVIISAPVLTGAQDAYYFYDVDAIDDDNDQLEYSLLSAPAGMAISFSTGLIEWTPGSSQIGIANVIAKASDGFLEDVQEFSIDVSNVNDLPVITSIPVTAAAEDSFYSYDADASDVDNDPLVYSLEEAPAGMSIGSSTGIVSWVPENGDVGLHNIVVAVSDGTGATTLPYTLSVENVNDAPVISSVPGNSATVNTQYSYDADASDIDNDKLQYSLLSAPAGMKIDSQTGLIGWNPLGLQAGENSVSVKASDGTLSAQQDFSIYVSVPEQRKSGGGSARVFLKSMESSGRKSEVSIRSPTDKVELRIEEIEERPKDAKGIENRVYKYLKIEKVQLESRETADEEFEVNFTVDKKWLKEVGVVEKDVVLKRYSDRKWSELETENVGNYPDAAKYKAMTPGFSYFAISVRDDVAVKSEIAPQISKIDAPFAISGTVYRFPGFMQAPKETIVAVKNMRTTEISGAVTEDITGAYSMLVPGQAGDPIEITVGNTGKSHKSELKDIGNLDFMLNIFGSGFSPVKIGLAYTAASQPHTILIAAILGSSFFILRKVKYNNKKKKR